MNKVDEMLKDFTYLELVFENVEVLRVSRDLVERLFISGVREEFGYSKDFIDKTKEKYETNLKADNLYLELDISKVELNQEELSVNNLYDDWREIEDKLTTKERRILSTDDDINILKRLIYDIGNTNICDINLIGKEREEDVKKGNIILGKGALSLSLPYNEGASRGAEGIREDFTNYNAKIYEDKTVGRTLIIVVDIFRGKEDNV